MLQILINFVFKILGFVANIILYPIILVFNAFIPGLGDTLSSFGTVMTQVTSAIPHFMNLFYIPESPFTVFFLYITGKYTFYVSYTVVKFAIKIYNTFKP